MAKEELTIRQGEDIDQWNVVLTTFDEKGEPEMGLEGYHTTPEILNDSIKEHIKNGGIVTITFQ